MGIVPAGVHAAALCSKGQPCFFFDLKGFHICPQGYGGSRVFSPDKGHDPRSGTPFPGDFHFIKLLLEVLCRAVKLEGKLRDAVEVPAPAYNFVLDLLSSAFNIHGSFSFLFYQRQSAILENPADTKPDSDKN
jgi:hypothetical protein